MDKQFKITTTGTAPGSPSEVNFVDLGERIFIHPTVSFDLLTEFRLEDILESTDVQIALDNVWITAEDENGNAITNLEDLNFVTTNDDRLTTENLVRVKKNPGEGEFSSVKDAIDSITTATFASQWIVEVGPGKFIEDTITMKSYVHVRGSGKYATIIEVDDPSKNVILGARHSSVVRCRIQGATDSGSIGVYFSNPSVVSGENSPFVVDDCVFGNNDILVKAEASTAVTVLTMNNIIVGGATFTQGFITSGTTGNLTTITLSNSQINSASSTTEVVFCKETTQIILNSVLITKTGATGQTAIKLSDGGSIRAYAIDIRNYAKGIWIENVGSAPFMDVVALNTTLNTQDIVVDHAGATGNIQGIAAASKVSIVSGALVSLLYLDPTDGIVFTDQIKIQFNDANNTKTDLSTLTLSESSMGLLSGGILTEAGSPPFLINISSGFGYVEDIISGSHLLKKIEWDDTSIALSTNSTIYIFFNFNGILSTDTTLPPLESTVLLGRVSTNGTGIEFIDASPSKAEHLGNSLSRTFRHAMGPIYESGSIVSEYSGSPSLPFHLSVGSGNYHLAENEFAPSGGSNIDFIAFYRDGLGGHIRVSTNEVDSSNYDDGSGILSPLTSGYYAKHSLYLVGEGTNEKYFLVYAQNEYPTLLEAQEANVPSPPSSFTEGVVLIAGIVIQEGASSITQVRDLRPVLGFRAEGVNASADHGSLIGLGDDDHIQYLLANGSRALTGNLNLGGNNINNGTWDGNTISIVKGGTGQTTQTSAFDALAPTTTKGDIIVHNGTDNVRLPVGGTNGQVLLVDSAEATGVKWGTADQINGQTIRFLSSNTGNSQTVVNTTTETNFTNNGTNFSLPGNTANANSLIRFLVYGRFSTKIGAVGTLTIRLKIGSTIINTSVITPGSALTNLGFQFTGQIQFRTIGAAGTIYSHLLCVFDSAGAASATTFVNSSNGTNSIDTTVANTIQMSAQWATADASNSITAEQVTFEILN